MSKNCTHTFVELEISEAAYEEIKTKLAAAGYQHAFHDEGRLIDMHGIAVKPTIPNMENALNSGDLAAAMLRG